MAGGGKDGRPTHGGVLFKRDGNAPGAGGAEIGEKGVLRRKAAACLQKGLAKNISTAAAGRRSIRVAPYGGKIVWERHPPPERAGRRVPRDLGERTLPAGCTADRGVTGRGRPAIGVRAKNRKSVATVSSFAAYMERKRHPAARKRNGMQRKKRRGRRHILSPLPFPQLR